MDVSLTLTCLNDAATVLESIESILSQTRLPDQVGAVMGPSADRTGELVQFYEEEFDFVTQTRSPQARSMGRENLRVEGLNRASGEAAVFVPARAYLYPGAVEEAIRVLDNGAECAVGGLVLVGGEREETTWSPPGEVSSERLLRQGPVPPVSTVWRTDAYGSLIRSIRVHRWGPFTVLGRLLQACEQGMNVSAIGECLGEMEDYLDGDFCWSGSSRSGLESLVETLDGPRDPEGVLETWIRRLEDHHPGGFSAEEDLRARREGRIERWLPGAVRYTE